MVPKVKVESEFVDYLLCFTVTVCEGNKALL